MYKALILDLDDTLYDYVSINNDANNAVASMAEHDLGVSSTSFMEAFSWARKDNKRILDGTAACHNRLLYFQKALEYLHLPPVGVAVRLYNCYWQYILDHMRLNEGALDLLDYCKSHSIAIGICSDLTALIQHRKIEKLGLIPYIDALVTSEEVGAEKPAPQMFRTILDKLCIKASEALYAGDSFEKDVLGAENMGIDVLWLNGDSSDFRTISSLREVKERLMTCGS